MNGKKAKLIRKFSLEKKYNYEKVKKKYKEGNWIFKTNLTIMMKKELNHD